LHKGFRLRRCSLLPIAEILHVALQETGLKCADYYFNEQSLVSGGFAGKQSGVKPAFGRRSAEKRKEELNGAYGARFRGVAMINAVQAEGFFEINCVSRGPAGFCPAGSDVF
jgi:hypothetical protein